jgi:hypothetical protein
MAEVRDLQASFDPGRDLPPHLQGVPACLHKYEPLFRRAADSAPRARE